MKPPPDKSSPGLSEGNPPPTRTPLPPAPKVPGSFPTSPPPLRKRPWKSVCKTGCQKMPKSAPKRPQQEHSGGPELQNYLKMEPKMMPNRELPTLTKHAPAWADRISGPPGDAPFSDLFQGPENIAKQYIKNAPGADLGRKVVQKTSKMRSHKSSYLRVWVFL